jgi:hypothetical protein
MPKMTKTAAGNTVPHCDKEVWEKGHHIMTAHTIREELPEGTDKTLLIENWVKAANKEVQRISRDTKKYTPHLLPQVEGKLDWSYIGGVPIIKFLSEHVQARKHAILLLINSKPKGVWIQMFYLD